MNFLDRPLFKLSCSFAWIILGILVSFGCTCAQTGYDPDVDFYAPQMWREYGEPRACFRPEGTPVAWQFSHTSFRGDLPAFGYPLHTALLVGLNDTLQAMTVLYNKTDKGLDLKGNRFEEWFAPEVYQVYVTSPGGSTFRDASELGFRVRGCYGSIWGPRKRDCPDTLYYENAGSWYITMDIWNLPEGKFQLCLLPTATVPSEFIANPWGTVFDCHKPRDLADSCNAYEVCYWRADDDSNFDASKKWVEDILLINPTSVPGWWLSAHRSLQTQDTAEAKLAFDNAIKYLNEGDDPAMPDSTQRPLMEIEKIYIQWLQRWLPYNREKLGP